VSTDRRLIRTLRPYTGLLLLAIVAATLASVFDGVTIVILIPFLKLLFGTAGPLSTGSTTLEQWTSRILAPFLDGRTVGQASAWIMGILVAALVLKNLFVYIRAQTNIRMQESVVRDLRRQLFDHLLVVDLRFFQETRVGQLLAALIADADQAKGAVAGSLDSLVQNTIMILTTMVILMTISWRLTLLTLLTAPILLMGIQALVRRIRRLVQLRAEERGHMTGIAAERLSAMKLIRASGTEAKEAAEWDEIVSRYRKRVIRTQRFSSLTSPVTEVFAGIVLVLVIFAATVPAVTGRPLGPEATIAFLLAALKMMSPLKQLTQFPTQWATAAAGAARIWSSTECRSATPRTETRSWMTCRLRFAGARSWPWWGPRGRAKPPWWNWCRGSGSRPRGRSGWTGCRSTG
jgi:ABC-type multidrug transport system fused ATPase/permease subunit